MEMEFALVESRTRIVWWWFVARRIRVRGSV